MTLFLDHNKYYRLPWTLPDNAISWLEVTKACNMYCEGCYRENDPKGHRPLEEIKHDLEIFRKFRKTDGVSLAGGDPLVHPDIVEIVRLIAQQGLKPIINTNGLALSKELLRDLKKAGVVGFTLHVDSKQHRPYWKGKTEVELNPLRLHFAEMLADVGGLSCAFNSTVYGDTLPYVPDIVEWGQEHIDIVHVLVFIAFRAAVMENHFDYYAGSERIDMGPVVYSVTDEEQRLDILSNDIVEVIRPSLALDAAWIFRIQLPSGFQGAPKGSDALSSLGFVFSGCTGRDSGKNSRGDRAGNRCTMLPGQADRM